MTRVCQVSPHHPKVRELLGPVFGRSGGRQTFEHLVDAVDHGDRTLFGALDDHGEIRSIASGALLEYPSGLVVMDLDHASGKMDDATALIDALAALGKDHGATRLQLEGRSGWIRALGDPWREYSRRIERKL